jgi:predicted anti-sigma-YlaC factor YlaD
MSLSALADGELPPEELLPVIDHLAVCHGCQAFYRDLRSLAASLPDPQRLPASTEAPEEIWQRIERAAAPDVVLATGRMRPWALRSAAAVLLVAGLWGALAAARSALGPVGAPIEVTLGEDRGRMTEQRFVDLTVELLRSDPRYHQEMLQVLTAVAERSGQQEAPADHDAPLPEKDEHDSGAWPRQRS